MTDNAEWLEIIESRQPAAGLTDGSPHDEADESEPGFQTPLERITALPEHVADRELTANQARARFVATDITDYGQSVPAGIRIDSGDIRRVLSAASDDRERIYRTTVSRVMNFLDRFGGDEVAVTKKHGRRFVVVAESLVDRLDRTDVCYGENGMVPLRLG